MARKILNGLAIAAGAGLGIGLSSNRNRRSESNLGGMPPSDDTLLLQTLLDRIEHMESRMRELEVRSVPVKASADAVTDLGNSPRLAEKIPEMVESIILARIEELRANLHTETRAVVHEILATFEKNVGDMVSSRISMLERTLIDQSRIITTLSQRAIASDENLQRLISAVERLCERTDVRPAALTVTDLAEPFEAQLANAAQRQTENTDVGFRPRIISPEEEKSLRHRVPLTRF
jgi:hypothetical protein